MKKRISIFLILWLLVGLLPVQAAEISTAEREAVIRMADTCARHYYNAQFFGPDRSMDILFDGWTPENWNFDRILNEKNREPLFRFAWMAYSFSEEGSHVWTDYEIGGKDDENGVTFRVPEDKMLKLLKKKLACDNLAVENLPFYEASTGSFLFSAPGGYGGPSLGDAFWTISRTAGGNWLAVFDKGSPDAGEFPEIYRELVELSVELTPDYRVAAFRLGADIRSLSWKTKPSVTIYPQGEPLRLDGAVLRVQQSAGASWEVTVTDDMVSGYDASKQGVQTLQVRYYNQSLEFQVTVEAPPTAAPPARPTTSGPTAVSTTAGRTTATAAPTTTPTMATGTDTTASAPDVTGSTVSSATNAPVTDEESDVEVSGKLPPDTRLQVAVVKNGESFKKVENGLPENAKNFTVLDISLTDSDNLRIQPDGRVEVSVPLPKTYGKHLAVYRLEEDGSLKRLESRIAGDRILFTTDHFSIYTIVELAEAAENPNRTPEEDGLSAGWLAPIIVCIGLILAAAGIGISIFWKRRRA